MVAYIARIANKDYRMISVIIRTYNRAALLPRAIRSVLMQERQDFEIIVVDDGSTDDTRAAVAEFTDPRIHYFYHEHSGNICRVANWGLVHATGDYIILLDDDDKALPGWLAKLAGALDAGAMIAHCFDSGHHDKGADYATVLKRGYLNQTDTMMARREVYDAIGDYDETIPIQSDNDIGIRFAQYCEVVQIPEQLVSLYSNSSSITRNLQASAREWHLLIDKWASEIERVCGVDALTKHRNSPRGAA